MARIIVPTDYSPTAEKAIDQAFLLAQKNNDEVELLHVISIAPSSESPKILDYVMDGKKAEKARLEALGQARIEALKLPASVRWRAKVLYAEHFIDGIVGRFEKVKAKLVVMGTTGASGLANMIFGSNTANLITKAALPVLAIPPSWKPTELTSIEFSLLPEQIEPLKKQLKKWAEWFGAAATVVYFANIATAGMSVESPFPLKTVLTIPEDSLYQDLVEYTNGLKGTALCMFVHERPTVFERIFDKSITGQVAGHIQIPMLALPLKA